MGLLISIITGVSTMMAFLFLFLAVVKLAWQAMLVSFIASLPISLYLIDVNPPLSFLGFTPLLLLIFTILLYRRSKKEMTYSF